MAQKWNAFQQAQILSNQRPEMSVGTMECNGIPVESEENFAHEIEQLIEKENFSSMMDLQDIAESDMKDFESGSLQDSCCESSWQDVMRSGDLEQEKSGDKGDYNGNMTPFPLPNSEVESTSEERSDEAVLETAFETDAGLVEYSDISSCSDMDANLDCNLSSSIEVNISRNQAGLSLEEGDQNSSNAMDFSSAEVCHSTVKAVMSEINLQQDTGPPVTMGESKGDVNHTCNEDSLISNSEDPCTEVQGVDNMNGVMLFSKDGRIEEKDIHSCDLDCFLDQTTMHCKELDASHGGSTSNHIETSSTFNENENNCLSSTSYEDENNCLTIDSLSVCQSQRTTPDAENASSRPELEDTFVISGITKDPCGDYQLDRMNPDPKNTPPNPEFQETTEISGHGKDSLGGCQLESDQPYPKKTSSKPGHGDSSQLEGQKCFTSDEQVERSSFGFLESCFGLKSETQNIEELKHLKNAHVNQVDESNLFNRTEPPVLLKTAFESNNRMDEGTDAPKDPLLCVDQTSRTSLYPAQHKCLTDKSTIASKDSLSYFKTQKRKLQPVVLLKTTEKKTCNGKNYHCFECQGSTQSIDELIEHYHSTHSLHNLSRSQYCPPCECPFNSGALTQHFCGEVKLSDKLKSSPSYTKGLTEEKAKFICRYCRKSFVRQAYYEDHELKHIVVTQHRCDCCGLYFPSAQKCQKHKRKAACTPLILDPPVQSAEHSEATLGKTDIPDMVETADSHKELRNCYVKLMDVSKTSQSPEQMHCQVCWKTFRLRAQLKSHLRSHSDEKPFKCDNCGKAFKYTWNLNKHKREQCSQKIVPHEKSSVPDSKFPKFKCPICPRIFKYSYNRTRHLREQCLKEYTKKGKGKIGGKYRCPLCKDVFTMASNRNRHIKQTCVKLKLYTSKGNGKKRKELEQVIKTKNEDKESTLPIPTVVKILPGMDT
ncbi:zinc finger protein 780B [Pimephales promelas]|nr:zinc finger protein 780B [Pimephales promelas]